MAYWAPMELWPSLACTPGIVSARGVARVPHTPGHIGGMSAVDDYTRRAEATIVGTETSGLRIGAWTYGSVRRYPPRRRSATVYDTRPPRQRDAGTQNPASAHRR